MKRVICSLAAILAFTVASAEDMSREIDSLQQRVAKLEKRAELQEKLQKHLKITGLLQTAYNWDNGGTSSFKIRRARLSLAGKIVENERVGSADYRLQVEFASSPKIVDLWVRYRPFNQLGAQIGEFKIPLSIENSEYAPLKLEFTEYSLVVQRLVRMSNNDVTGISTAGRDLGAQLYGGFIKRNGYNIINYNLALFNGNGINKSDNNRHKDFVGRLMVCPIEDLTIAGYYQYGVGQFSQSTLPDLFATDGNGNIIGSERVAYQRYGGGVAYNSEVAFARAEYIGGITGVLRSEGAYASAGWKYSTARAGSGSVGLRFDYFDRDLYNPSREFNYTLGVSYQPWRYLRLQLDYAIKQYQHLDQPLTHCLTLMVSGSF